MNVSRRTALELVGAAALCGDALLPSGTAAAAPPHPSPFSPDLGQYDLIWTEPSRDASESMPCGGGDIGLNLWVEQGDVLCYLSRSGAFDELNGFPKFGRLRLQLSPNPFAAYTTFRQQLHLEQGFVEIVGTRGDLTVTLHFWVDVHAPVIHLETEANQDVQVTVALESWRLATRDDLPGEDGSHRSFAGAPHEAVHLPDEVGFLGNDVVATHHNLDHFSAFDLCVGQQQLTRVKDRLWNPLHNLCFGTLLRGEHFIPAGTGSGRYASTPFRSWKLRSAAPAKKHHLRCCLHIDTAPSREAWLTGALQIAGGSAVQDRSEMQDRGEVQHRSEVQGGSEVQDAGSARQKTIAWWRAFWDRSYISILPGPPQPQRPEWRIARNYQLFRYQLGCNAHGNYPTKFNGGLFTFDPEYVRPDLCFDPDYRLWGGGSFTAQNQRMVYWPLLKSGDFDLMTSQFLFYTRALGNAEQRTEVYWHHRGASFTEQIESFGLPVAFEYGWDRPPGLDPGLQWSRYVDRLWDTSLEFCFMILERRRFSASDISPYLPLILSCVRFFDEHYQQQYKKTQGTPLNAEGKLVFFPGTALETYKDALNSTVTIAALQSVLTQLLALPPHYLTAEQRSYLQGYRQRLPSLPFRHMQGHRVLAPAELWDRLQNVEIPQLYPVFPYPLYGIGHPDLQTAIDTWRFGVDTPQQKNFISWHQDAIFCARLGLTEEAAAITLKKLDDAPRRCPTFWGPGHDWVPDHNWGGSGMVGLQEMLLQTVDEQLFLFPAWPSTWDVAFKLHAPQNTTVEAHLAGKVLQKLVVTPPGRRKDLVLPAWLSEPPVTT